MTFFRSVIDLGTRYFTLILTKTEKRFQLTLICRSPVNVLSSMSARCEFAIDVKPDGFSYCISMLKLTEDIFESVVPYFNQVLIPPDATCEVTNIHFEHFLGCCIQNTLPELRLSAMYFSSTQLSFGLFHGFSSFLQHLFCFSR